MSRVDKSKKNIFFGLMQQCSTLILTFVTRTVFIKYLSIDLLGVNSLFANILTVLSLADLGFGTAILYSMYKPLADNDQEKLSALMNFFRKIYICIAIIVFLVGIGLLPFLHFIIKENNIANIEIYYCLFLADSIISYLLAYKVNIINADQKTYIIKKYTLIFNIIKSIIQCFVIIVFKSFIAYLLVQILCTFFTNIYGAYISRKMYPYICTKKILAKEDKKSIMDNVKSLFLYKIGGIILNNTDNILISSIINIVTVGFYTNYITIINAITNITSTIFTTITFSVGNLIATENKEKQLDVFYKIDFLANLMFSFISVSLLILLNDLIICWLGKNYIIDELTIVFVVVNFYMVGVLNSVLMFRDTTGLFRKTKYIYMITALLNIILSILLGIKFGLAGIIAATAISRLLTNFWYEPLTIFKSYFNKSSFKYFRDKLLNALVLTITTVIVNYCTKFIKVTGWGMLFTKTAFVVILSSIIFILIYSNTPYFKYYFTLVKSLILKNKKKIDKGA